MLRAREISPVELTRYFLDRLDEVARPFNAVVTITDDAALREAALAEAELLRGVDRGPLHGIPYGAKDIIATAGIPTTWGASPFAEQVFDYDATVVRRLRDAGAVLAAKVATVEIAGGMGYKQPGRLVHRSHRQPAEPRTWAGGSSSGPAAVVAAGALPFAIGSDTSGSIVLPAAWTGTAGLRATYGRVSRRGAMTLCWTLDRLGPLCRTAHDCGLVLEAIAGPDPEDPASLREPTGTGAPRPAQGASGSASSRVPRKGPNPRSRRTSRVPSALATSARSARSIFRTCPTRKSRRSSRRRKPTPPSTTSSPAAAPPG